MRLPPRCTRHRKTPGPSALPARWLVLVLAGLPLAVAGAETFVWVDENGVTQLTDDPAAVPDEASDDEVDRLRALWGNERVGPVPPTPVHERGGEEGRIVRLLRGAVQDLRRGETARAAATLRSVLRMDPRRPEAHWYLALLDRQRGRYGRSEDHLRSFLAHAGPELQEWRSSAKRRLATLADERRLADPSIERGALEFVAARSDHFRVQIDSELDAGRREYASTVMRYLEEARQGVADQVGVVSSEPLGVVFYGKAAYLEAYRHRFSFQTVGFFDGRIHVTSPAHPSGGLRSLLFHEYTHALFREQTGGDRPYWLNEGLAERIERLSRLQPPSTRSERASLRTRIEAGDWIPLRRLAPSFSGLSDEDARAAYLQSVVAAEWIETNTDRAERARLLQRIGEGYSADQALHEAVGLDTDGLDEVLQAAILGEFPDI